MKKRSDPKDYLKEPYARILIPDEEGGFCAEILEFPGCFADGETPSEAFANLEKAAESWIQASIEQGHEIPPPSSNTGFSGKIALRIPRSMHRQAVRIAERDGTSLNQFLLGAIAARLGAEYLYGAMARRLENRIVLTAANVTELAASAVRAYSEEVTAQFLPPAEQTAHTAPHSSTKVN